MALNRRDVVAAGVGAALIALIILALCATPLCTGIFCGLPDPPPPGAGVEIVALDSASREALLLIAEGEIFETSYDAGDVQRLMLGTYPGYTRHGPLVRIQPNTGSHAVDTTTLATGYVVARWINYDSASYPKLGTAGMDTTYWFVDSIPAGGWRSRYVSTRYTGTMVVDTTLVIHPSNAPHTSPRATWIWLEEDEQGWVTCTVSGCCTSGAGAAVMQFTSGGPAALTQ